MVTNLLKAELGFDGLIFTDALNMKGASSFKKPGDIDLEAFLAGNDILLFAENVPLASEKICMAYQEGQISEERLSQSVKKILKYKFKSGLNKYKPIDLRGLSSELNEKSKDDLQYKLYENAITVLKNDDEILPIKELNQKIAYIKLGDDTNETFLSTLQKFADVTEVKISNIDTLKTALSEFDKVIIGFHKSDKAWKKHDFTDTEIKLINEISSVKDVILDVFTKPYSLMQIDDFSKIKGLIVSYQNSIISQEVSAQIIFGTVDAKGQLRSLSRSMFGLPKLRP